MEVLHGDRERARDTGFGVGVFAFAGYAVCRGWVGTEAVVVALGAIVLGVAVSLVLKRRRAAREKPGPEAIAAIPKLVDLIVLSAYRKRAPSVGLREDNGILSVRFQVAADWYEEMRPPIGYRDAILGEVTRRAGQNERFTVMHHDRTIPVAVAFGVEGDLVRMVVDPKLPN